MLITDKKRKKYYLDKYPIENLFGIPVQEHLVVHEIEKDAYFFRHDRSFDRLLFLVEGRAKCYQVHADGTESIFAFMEPGNIIGDMKLVGAITRDYLVQALKPCIVIELRLSECKEQILKDVKFMRLLATLLGNKIYYQDVRLSTTQQLTTKQSLARFVLYDQHDGVFSEALTTTAQYLAVNYRQLQRVIAEFCDSGFLTRANGKYLITDPAALERIVPELSSNADTDDGFLPYL